MRPEKGNSKFSEKSHSNKNLEQFSVANQQKSMASRHQTSHFLSLAVPPVHLESTRTVTKWEVSTNQNRQDPDFKLQKRLVDENVPANDFGFRKETPGANLLTLLGVGLLVGVLWQII